MTLSVSESTIELAGQAGLKKPADRQTRELIRRPSNRRKQMKLIGLIAVSFAMTATAAAQDAVPNLTGAWKGTGKILLYGTTEHLTGSAQNAVVRDLEVTHKVEGQDGRLLWGTTSSANNDSREPF